MNLSSRTILGLDISDHSLEVLGLQKKFWGKPKVVAYNRLVLEPKIVEDGQILEPALLVDCLKQLLQTAWPGPAKAKLCLLSFPESQVFTHLFRLPGSFNKADLKKVLLNEIEELKSISINDIYFDWQISRRTRDETTIFFVACDKKLVHQYVQVLHQSGLIPLAFDLESASASRALLNLSRPDAFLLVDIGARTTNATFLENGRIFGSLTIPIGGNNFTAALASQANLSLSQAEALKKEIGFDVIDPEIAKILQQQFRPIIIGLQDFLDYYQREGFKQVKKIILTGGSALIPNLLDFLTICFDEPVLRGEPLSKVYLRGYQPDPNFIFYANVVGLALRGLQPAAERSGLNLLARGDNVDIK